MIREQRGGEWSPGLGDGEKTTLFAVARDTLDWCVHRRRGAFAFDSYELTPKIEADCATFVTLKRHGELRGCVGTLEPIEPMYMSVHNNAVNAAMRDFRFPQMTPLELKDIEIHVSLLSPIRELAAPEEFVLGRHGIILQKGMARSVFLPEVALEQGWTREETLDWLSEKAGLSRDAWRQDAKFFVYESVVLAED